MKKNLFLNLTGLISISCSFVTSCTQVGNIEEDVNFYAKNLMNKTSKEAKLLLLDRSENLNIGSFTQSYMMYLLPDSEYNKKLGSFLTDLESINGNWNKKNVLNTSSNMVETSDSALLSAVCGDGLSNNAFNKHIIAWWEDAQKLRQFDLNTSSVFETENESGPLKTFFMSNEIISKKNPVDNIFSNNNYLLGAFASNANRYDSTYNNQISNLNNSHIKSIEVGKSDGITIGENLSDRSKKQYLAAKNDVNLVNTYDFFKQLLGLNEVSKSLPLVSNINNISNMYLFLDNLFALDKNSDNKVFGNLGGTLFSKLYDGQGTVEGIKSLIFDKLFSDSKKIYYNDHFVDSRNKILNKKVLFSNNDRISLWFSSLQKKIGASAFKSWLNGHYENQNESIFDMQFNTVKDNNGGSTTDTLNNIINDLYNTYQEYFSWIDSQENSDEMYQVMNNDLYNNIKSAESLVGTFIGKDWGTLLDNISQKIKTTTNPEGTVTAKAFINGLLNLFMLVNSSNDAFQKVKKDVGLNTLGDIYNLDMSNEKNKLRVYEALGYQNGYIVKGSIFDNLYNIFNNKNNISYSLLHSLFIDNDSAIKQVFLQKYQEVKDASLNALFDEPTMGINVKWKFSNPVYDSDKKTITYEVDYTGPGDTSFDYKLHYQPIISKDVLQSFKSTYWHTTDNKGIWDNVLKIFDNNPNKYNMNWFLGYDGGTSNTYKSVNNKYIVTFKNISQYNDRDTYAIYSLKWYHDNAEYYDLFE